MTYTDFQRLFTLIMKDEIRTAQIKNELRGSDRSLDVVVAYLKRRVAEGNGGCIPKALKSLDLVPARRLDT